MNSNPCFGTTSVTLLLLIVMLTACQQTSNSETSPVSQLSPETAIEFTLTTENFNGPLPPFLTGIVIAPKPAFRSIMHSPHTGQVNPLLSFSSNYLAETEDKTVICVETVYDFGDERVSSHRYLFSVNEVWVESHSISMITDEIVRVGEEKETVEIIGEQPMGPVSVCSFLDIGAGSHIVLLQIIKETGEVLSYSWSFELVKEN